jgi:sugar-specific transcriptional regulator TrmB
MSKETIILALKDFGLTKKEVEVYILLAKKGPLKGTEIAKQIKRNRGQVYRILKSLQKKGFVEVTLEYPKRFVAVTFEKVLEIFAKIKRNELAKIEEGTEILISDWERISKTDTEDSLEKFVVIEGNKKIYRKITDMIEQTKNSYLAIMPISDFVRAEQFGVFESAKLPQKKMDVEFCVLTNLTEENLKAFKLLRTELKPNINVKTRNPDFGMSLFPRMIINDQEILVFISSTKQSSKNKRDVCIHTNCESLVKAFTTVFEDLWRTSIKIEDKIIEIETGKPTQTTTVIADEESAKKKYQQTIQNAEKEIILMTSEEDLIKLSENTFPLIEEKKRILLVKILAPITKQNFEYAKRLSENYHVRHFRSINLGTTIVDSKHLFRFRGASLDPQENQKDYPFKDTFYTTDITYIKKTKDRFNEIWSNAYNITETKVHPILRSQMDAKGRVVIPKDIKKLPKRLLSAGKSHHSMTSGILGDIIITPPSQLKMPDMKISIFHVEEEKDMDANSPRVSAKSGDLLRVDFWLKTPKGENWVPVALALNASPKVAALEKAKWANTIAGKNMIIVKPEELHVWKEGKTLFAGWTVPIPLPPKYKLDPACILFEAFGDEYHGAISFPLPSGYLMGIEYDGFQAFTNFIGPSWKYSGPGITGFVGKLIIVNALPEKNSF